MARLRRLPPGAIWFVTVRCEQRRFRLRPDAVRSELVGFHLAAANNFCPGIQLYAACQMGNHLHLVLKDRHSQLSAFMMHFNGLLARSINRLDGVDGRFFERRFTAIQILDEAALLDRIVYTLCNPVAASLVQRTREWPGLLGAAATVEPRMYRRFDHNQYQAAVRRARKTNERVRRSDFLIQRRLEFVSPPTIEDEVIRSAVRSREQALAAERQHGVLGIQRMLAMDPFSVPSTRPPKKSIPWCHTSSSELLRSFRSGWREFVDLYRHASAQFRLGRFDVRFPDWSFRPCVPLLL